MKEKYDLAGQVIGLAKMKVHSAFGPWFS